MRRRWPTRNAATGESFKLRGNMLFHFLPSLLYGFLWLASLSISTEMRIADYLNRFIRAFVDDKIFQNAASKNAMLAWNSTGEYGLGVARVDYAANGINGVGVIIGDDGFPESFMFYWPDQDTTIVGTLNQFAPATTPALVWVAEILKQVKLQLNS